MFESLFEFLFKDRPLIYGQGEVRVALSSVATIALVIAAAAAVVAIVTYQWAKGESRARDRAVLVGIRLAVVAVLLVCLVRPVLVLRAAAPQQNFVAVLLDDSRSMRIADREGEPRSAVVQQLFGKPESPVIAALSQRFAIRYFRFGASAERINAVGDLTYGATQTRIGDALSRVREELAGLPLAGVVAVTDGADTSQAALTQSLLAMQADRVPVYTVGIGRETFAKDIQVSRVAMPRQVLKGTTLLVDVTVTAAGYRGTTAPLNIEDSGRILGSQDVTLPGDGEPATVRVRFTANDRGSRVFRVRIPVQDGEMEAQNNVREAVVEVQDRRERILYFEGEPRFETKFIRRAVSDDKNIQLTVLQRTAENKYLRLDVNDGDELAAGFPKTREELFKYRGLILGSVEAGAFTPDQLRMVADFVDRRGGGLIMLGGRRSFGEGGYAGTPVGDVLPVVLERAAGAVDDKKQNFPVTRLSVRPTRAGAGHAVTQVAKTEKESAERWKDLPQLTSVNVVRQLKPGAAVLLTGLDDAKREQIVLASQRYGRGKAIALPVQDSWMWQLDAGIAVEDMTHENFWRQLLRWCVEGAPDPVALRMSSDHVEPGQPATLIADVVDPSYVEVNNAKVTAKLLGPTGQVIETPMTWGGERNGEYTAVFTPTQEGAYEATAEASRDAAKLGSGAASVRAAPDDSEYFDATMRAPLLQRIASDTGGRFYTPETVQRLPEDMKYSTRGVTVVEERDLWDMPALLLLLIALLTGEWTYRRARGLA